MSNLTIPYLMIHVCTAIVGPHFRLGVYEGSDTLLLEIFAPSSHIAHLIGREGRMARALRDIALAAGYQQGLRVYLQVWDE